MTQPKPKTVFLTVRVTPGLRNRFAKRAEKFGRPSEVLRELVAAFVDDRVTLSPPPDKEDLYVPRASN